MAMYVRARASKLIYNGGSAILTPRLSNDDYYNNHNVVGMATMPLDSKLSDRMDNPEYYGGGTTSYNELELN